jgi:hypothetical protein
MVDYFKEADKILNIFLKIKDTDDWEYITTIKDSDLHKKLFPKICVFPAYRMKTDINKSAIDIYQKIWKMNETDAKVIDPNLISHAEIERGHNWKVVSQCNGGWWPVVMARSIVFFQVKFNINDKIYIVAKSIDHEKEPESDSCIRANIHLSVYELIPIDENNTRINYIVHIDPRGYIPVWLAEMYSTNILSLVNSWKT